MAGPLGGRFNEWRSRRALSVCSTEHTMASGSSECGVFSAEDGCDVIVSRYLLFRIILNAVECAMLTDDHRLQ